MRPLSVSPPTEVPFCNCRILTRLSPFKTVPLVAARLSLHFPINETIKDRRMVAVKCNVFIHEIQISRRQWFSRTDLVLPVPSSFTSDMKENEFAYLLRKRRRQKKKDGRLKVIIIQTDWSCILSCL
jgi:hypothetical protein